MELKIYKTKQEVAVNFCEYLADFITQNESLHIALSGGSTPKIVFDELAANYTTRIDWQKVHLYWGDERCVPPEDVESNYKMTVDHLLSKIDIPKKNVHRIHGENSPDLEALRYAKVLGKELPKKGNTSQFDIVLLGMGDDGHTASIFPHEIELWNSENYCEVAIHPDSGQNRVTITGRLINAAREVIFLVTGRGKAQKVVEIVEEKGAYTSYPAALVTPTSEKLVWFLDADAAAELTR